MCRFIIVASIQTLTIMPWAVQARHRGIILLIAIVLSSNLSLQDPFVNVLSDGESGVALQEIQK